MYDAGSAAMASGLVSFQPGPGVGTANVVAASAGCLVCEISDHTRRRYSTDRPTGTCRWRNEELGGPSTDIHIEPSLHSHHPLPFRSLPSSYPFPRPISPFPFPSPLPVHVLFLPSPSSPSLFSTLSFPFPTCPPPLFQMYFSFFVFVCAAVYGVKGKVFPYSLPSVGAGADPGVQAVSPQVT